MIRACMFIAVLAALGAGPFRPSQAFAHPVVDVDHPAHTTDFTRTVRLAPGQFFDVVLRRTSESFTIHTYEFRGEPGGRDSKATGRWQHLIDAAKVDELRPDSTVVTIPHREGFGGYLVEIRSKTGAGVTVFAANPGIAENDRERVAAEFDALDPSKKTQAEARARLKTIGEIFDLKPVRVFVQVDSDHEAARFGAGFCASWLNDEKYKSETIGTEAILRRDSGAESPVRPLAVAFVHIVPSPRSPASLSLGLGVNGDSELAILPGVSAVIAEKMFVTAGVHIGAIKTKPVGTEVGRPIQDVSVLTKPDTRFDSEFFIAFTYAFLGQAKETLSKPFALPKASTP